MMPQLSGKFFMLNSKDDMHLHSLILDIACIYQLEHF